MSGNVPAYVADTHSLLWYFYDEPRLGPRANNAFREIETGEARLIIPIIVIAELIFIVEKGRIQVDISMILAFFNKSSNCSILPLDLDQVLCLPNLMAIPEMHDRMIVAATQICNARLISRDSEIRTAGIVEVIW